MTQKELLYVEDAIAHEESLIEILNEYLKKISDENIITFMDNQISSHKDIKNKLISLLKEKVND